MRLLMKCSGAAYYLLTSGPKLKHCKRLGNSQRGLSTVQWGSCRVCRLLRRVSERQVSLMDESGNTKDDLKLPTGTDDAEKLAEQLQAEFESGKEIAVTVLKACLPA